MSETTIPIKIPTKAAEKIADLVKRRNEAQTALDDAAAILLAAIDAPEGWQLQFTQDGMIAVPPAASE